MLRFAVAAAVLLSAGCSKPPEEHKITIELKGPEEPKAEPESPAETDKGVALTEMARLQNEADAMSSGKSAVTRALTDILLEANRREKSDGPEAAAKWYRQQVEGKKATDFIKPK